MESVFKDYLKIIFKWYIHTLDKWAPLEHIF